MPYQDYRDEDVLKHAREAFSDTIALKLQHLRRYVRKGANPALTGAYIEELVRGFIRKWINPLQLRHGTLFSDEFATSGATPLQIDGIVYDPSAGPTVLDEGEFVVVHPAFCRSVIEIKTSFSGNLDDFESRLRLIYDQYMHHVTTVQVMGIVIADPDPAKKCQVTTRSGREMPSHQLCCGYCPIFILFQEIGNEYKPHEPAIDAMIRTMFTRQYIPANYL